MKGLLTRAAFSALLAFGMPAAQAPAARPAPKVIVPMDTEVELRILQTVSSAESRVNEKVLFEVVDDVIASDAVIIPHGSKAWGIVTAVEPKSRLRKNGKIDIDLQAVCLPGGTGAPLRAYRRGAHRTPGDEPSAGDSLFALPALPVLAFLYGKDVAIPKGREFTAYLSEAISVPRPQARPEAAQACPSPQEEEIQRKVPVIPQPELAAIAVKSKPEGAEIWVNGRFMGQTPATLRLPPGEHQVQLRSPDKVPWERVVVATPGGNSTLQAVLESTVMVRR